MKMLIDLIVGIAASLIASAIVGFLGNKAVSNSNSIILKLYVLFLSVVVFICCSIVSIVLNKDFGERILKINEVNLLRFYQNCINSFMLIIGAIVFVTLIVILLEASDRGDRRFHEQSMDRYKTYTK